MVGASPDQKKEFILEEPKSYAFLSSGGIIPVPGVDDSAEFQSTCKAMGIMGMTNEDLSAIFRIVSAVMLFGSMKFKQERNSDQVFYLNASVRLKIKYLILSLITWLF